MGTHVEAAHIDLPFLGAIVPGSSTENVRDEGLYTQLWHLAGRSIDVHRLQAAIGLAVVVVDEQVPDVVDVIVSDEELVGLVIRHTHVLNAAFVPAPTSKMKTSSLPSSTMNPAAPCPRRDG